MLESETQQTQQQTKPVETQATPDAPPKKKTLEELFAETDESQQKQPQQNEGRQSSPDESRKAVKMDSLNNLAESLGVKVEDLYKVKIPLEHGKSATLGELKDGLTKVEALSTREMQFEENRVKREGELLTVRNELMELITALPNGAVTPEAVQKIRERHDKHVEGQRKLAIEFIPEWKDEAVRTKEIGEMIEHMKGYGFHELEFKSLFDARTIRYIRENMRREARVKAVLAKVEEQRPSTSAPSKSTGAAPRKPATGSRRTGKSDDSRSAIMNILNK